jgi:hypothetical protein
LEPTTITLHFQLSLLFICTVTTHKHNISRKFFSWELSCSRCTKKLTDMTKLVVALRYSSTRLKYCIFGNRTLVFSMLTAHYNDRAVLVPVANLGLFKSDWNLCCSSFLCAIFYYLYVWNVLGRWAYFIHLSTYVSVCRSFRTAAGKCNCKPLSCLSVCPRGTP